MQASSMKTITAIAKREPRIYITLFVILVVFVLLISPFNYLSKNIQVMETKSRLSNDVLPQCRLNLSAQGHIDTEATVKNLEGAVSRDNLALMSKLIQEGLNFGGHSSPKNCKPIERVAIIIPFRNRHQHLDIFLRYMHPYLQKKLLDYRIFVIEQTRELPLNRGSLKNIGFLEALNSDPSFDCFIFHDVDLLPEHERNDYSCPPEGKPRQLVWLVDFWDYKPKYPEYAGGVTAISKRDFILINGFSNKFWDWGSEDDDYSRRLSLQNLTLTRNFEGDQSAAEYVKFRSLYHKQAKINKDHMKIFNQSKGIDNLVIDGISSLKYEKKHFQLRPYFTHITVALFRDNLVNDQSCQETTEVCLTCLQKILQNFSKQ